MPLINARISPGPELFRFANVLAELSDSMEARPLIVA